jgi:hypothetical protein
MFPWYIVIIIILVVFEFITVVCMKLVTELLHWTGEMRIWKSLTALLNQTLKISVTRMTLNTMKNCPLLGYSHKHYLPIFQLLLERAQFLPDRRKEWFHILADPWLLIPFKAIGKSYFCLESGEIFFVKPSCS